MHKRIMDIIVFGPFFAWLFASIVLCILFSMNIQVISFLEWASVAAAAILWMCFVAAIYNWLRSN